jgi:hypothetical protein
MATNRSSMIRRAFSLPVGHSERKALLSKLAGSGPTGGYVEDSIMKALDGLGLAIGGIDYRFSRDGRGRDTPLHTPEEKKKMGEAQHKLEQAKKLTWDAYKALERVDLQYTGKGRTPR